MWDIPSVGHFKFHVSIVPIRNGVPLQHNFLSDDIEGIACLHREVLVFGGVVDGVFADEFERVVGWIAFEDTNGSLGKGDAQGVLFGV